MSGSINIREKWISTTYLLWWLTMPFQSKVIGISLGAFTLYPNLFLSIILFGFFLIQFKSWNNSFKLVQSFLLFWILYGIMQALLSNSISSSFFDIRSLVLQFLFSAVLFGMFFKLGFEEFKRISIKGIQTVLFTLLIFGLFEFFTGIHFSGHKTDEMNLLPVSNHFYAPMFIFDNQNTYLTYVISFVLFLTLMDEKFKSNIKNQLLIWSLIYLFSLYAESSLAKFIVYLNILFLLVQRFKSEAKAYQLKNIWPFLLSFAMIIGLYFSNEKYFGPLYGNSAAYRINTIQSIEKDSLNRYRVVNANKKYSKAEQIELIEALDSIHKNNPYKSINVRKQMINVGIELISNNMIFGAGPGAFDKYCAVNKDRFQLKTQRSAHNFPIEIISQFGFVAWIYLALIGSILTWLFLNKFRQSRIQAFGLVVFSISIAVSWLMPSSFLLLEVSRLFLPLIVICYFSEKSANKYA